MGKPILLLWLTIVLFELRVYLRDELSSQTYEGGRYVIDVLTSHKIHYVRTSIPFFPYPSSNIIIFSNVHVASFFFWSYYFSSNRMKLLNGNKTSGMSGHLNKEQGTYVILMKKQKQSYTVLDIMYFSPLYM